jgi:hypothetical protein
MGLGYVPNQSIYAAFGPQYSNATALQVTYATSRRGSITASGSYGTLNFVDPGNVDNNTTSGTVGYNYELTQQNSIGGFYRFSGYHFAGQPQAYGSNSFNLAFSRKLTGRMALQAYGGPDITTFRIPVDGQSSKIGANLGVSLSYAFKGGGLSGGYFQVSRRQRCLCRADQANLAATHALSRIWSGHLNFGYAHNKAIVSSAAASSAGYNSWFFGGGVTRPLGRNTILAIAYSANINRYMPSGCTGNSCSSNQTTYNSIIVNFQWHTRPMVLP